MIKFNESPRNYLKKREVKAESIQEEEEKEGLKHFSIDVSILQSKGEQSDSYSSDKIIELRPDGRPKRDIKKKMHFDEKYPPQEHTPKKRKYSSKNSLRSYGHNDTPSLSRKRSSTRRTHITKPTNELNSDDEEYQEANKRVEDIKGRQSSMFLIRKYINKIKYCFDKLKVLSSENHTKDINLNENDLD